jgi:hypothetical protein
MNKPTYEELQAERDAFAIRLEDAENQYSELHDKNSALAAQIEVLRSALSKCRFDSLNMSLNDWNDVQSAYRATPAACLAQVRTDAVHEFVNYVVDNDLSNTLEAAAFQFSLINKGDKP